MSTTEAQDATGVANRSAEAENTNTSNQYDRVFPIWTVGNSLKEYQENHIDDKYAIFKKPAKMRLLSTDLPGTGPCTGENQ